MPALGAAAVAFCAVFFGGGDAIAPLVWIGGLALVLAALLLVRPPTFTRPSALFAGSLAALALWCGLTALWSTSPDRSWQLTNRVVVYLAFALVGLAVGARVPRSAVAAAAATLAGLVVGWALLAKCVPALYSDYGRVARLRAPLEYWNELALLCDVGVPLALLLAARRRVVGVVLLYGLVVTVLLTYSRFGVALACAAAAAWILLTRERVECLAASVLAGAVGSAVFGVALALPGITRDGQSRAARAHDGWIFALAVLAGAALVAAVSATLAGREPPAVLRRRVERVAGVTAAVLVAGGLAVGIAYAGRIWHEFTNPVAAQVQNSTARLGTARSDRWSWWQEAWHAFTRHPLGGTGAGTFELTHKLLRRSPVFVDEPHNTPLRFLSETGIVGFLLYLGVAAGALWNVRRARAEPATLALTLGVAAFFVHNVVDKDWNYVATCGPLLLVAGVLASQPSRGLAPRRIVLAAGAVVVAGTAVYSLALPWLSQRTLASAASAADAKRAHSYDPLSTDALIEWATWEDGAGNVAEADSLYHDAVRLEPENGDTWYALGSFYFGHRRWTLAWDALNNAYTYDRYGPAGQPCGLLDQARRKAFGYVPPSAARCPAGG